MDQIEPLTEIRKVEGAVEAILFAAGHPVEYAKIAQALSLTPRDARRIAEHMADLRNADENGGIMMLIFEDSCQLCTREDYLPYVREALGIRRGGNLSASSLEVLSIIAYNQPVTRTFIDTVRGVDSAYAVNSLIDKELIVSVGRLDAPGRPMLFGTTEKFLRVFGLSSIADLPEAGSVEASMASAMSGERTPDGAPQSDAESAGSAPAADESGTGGED